MEAAVQQAEEKQNESLLNLAAKERVVRVKFSGRALRIFFRPLTLKDWRWGWPRIAAQVHSLSCNPPFHGGLQGNRSTKKA